MATFLSVLIIIVCCLLVLIILIQNPKGGGIASNFMSSNQFIGAKQQVELVEQVTWGFVGGLVVLCIAFAGFVGTGTKAEVKESIVSKSEMPMPGTSAPTMPAQQQVPTPTPAPAPNK
ncbi:MAG: preprotein translocase subunit SecG [Bacteroidetes bacterium]|nr:preprotein translocase subunit SecG [Bacteroidota bacterium]